MTIYSNRGNNMLPIILPYGITTFQVDAETLYDVKVNHIKHRCFKLYTFLRLKGLSRSNCNEIRNSFNDFLQNEFDIDLLINDDNTAQTIRIGRTGFIIPEAARPNSINIMNRFLDKPEALIMKNLIDCCPSVFIA